MKKSMKIIPLLVMIFLVSLSYACAADTNVNNLTDSDVLTSTDDDMAISTANNEEIVKSINVSSKTFSDLSKEIKGIISVEDHNEQGGLGDMIARTLSNHNCSKLFVCMGVKEILNRYGTYEYIKECNGIDKNAIIRRVKELLKFK